MNVNAHAILSEFGIKSSTLNRWMTDPEIAFPHPCMKVGHVRYWDDAKIAGWRQARELSSKADSTVCSATTVCKKFDITRRTLSRWMASDPTFPSPTRINDRLFFKSAEINAWTEAKRRV